MNWTARVSRKGFKEQFRALIVAIEIGQPSLAPSTSRKERELKRLLTSINYNGRGWNILRSKCKERVVNNHP